MSEYSVTAHIEIGPDSLEKLPELLKAHGSKVLLVHGHRPVEDGLLQKVRLLLNKAGFPHANMGQILPNPKYSSIKRGIRIARKEHCDLILALGGGSTLQCAKAVALGVPYKGDIWDFWTGKKQPQQALPIASVMTNPSSSSELRDSVTLVRKGKQKTIHTGKAQCAFAILDPCVSKYPPYPTMCQSMCLLADLCEAWLCPVSGPKGKGEENPDAMERSLYSMLIRQLFDSAQKLLADFSDVEARNNLYWIGLLTHSVQNRFHSDLSSLANDLSFQYSLPLGTALSSLFPAWLKQMADTNPDGLASLGQSVSGQNMMDAEGAARWLGNKITELQLPMSLPQTGAVLDEKMLKDLAGNKTQLAILRAASRDIQPASPAADEQQ